MFNRGLLFLVIGSVSLFSKSVYWIGLDWNEFFPSVTKHWKDMVLFSKEHNVEIKFLLGTDLSRNIEHYKRVFIDNDTAYVVLENSQDGQRMLDYCSAVPYKKRALIAWEPPTVLPNLYSEQVLSKFAKVLTFNNHLVDNVTFIKVNFPDFRPMISDTVAFDKKKFSCMIFGNKSSNQPLELYSLRRRVIQYFSKNTTDFDLYGVGWPSITPNYMGSIPEKISVIKNYKFCFAMENTRDISGYLTEKIWHVFAAGSIPIYWGDTNVTKEIPSDCYVDFRKFASISELVRYLQAMDQEEYERRILCIKEFLQTDTAKKYSYESFYQNIVTTLGK